MRLQKINPQLAGSVELQVQLEPVAKVPVTDLFSAGRTRGTLMLWVVFFMNLMVVTDDVYGTLNPLRWLDRTFNVPDLAVGRLLLRQFRAPQ